MTRTHAPRSRAAALRTPILIAIAAAPAGCLSPKPSTPTVAEPIAATGDGDAPIRASEQTYRNPFPPTRIVIHPLTRFSTDPASGERQLELHAELFDKYSHPVKSLGLLTIELRRASAAGSTSGDQLRRWEVDLSRPGLHERAYDRVTRTYRLLLRDLPPGIGESESLSVVVYFRIIDAATTAVLSAERPLTQ